MMVLTSVTTPVMALAAAVSGRGEEGASAFALPAFEVAVAGGYAVLAGLQLIAVHRDAHGAAGFALIASGGAEDLGQTFGNGLPLHFHGAGNHHHAHVRVDFAAFENWRRHCADRRCGSWCSSR